MLEICLVSMDLDEVRAAVGTYPCNCFADNPTVAVKGIGDSGEGFLARSRDLRALIGPEAKLYLEVMGESCDEMVADARRIVDEVPGNTLVKIPACPEGYRAIRKLRELGIRASCTAVFNVTQALLAQAAGAVCVAVYVSRLNSAGGDGIAVVRDIVAAFRASGSNVMVCAASLKTPRDLRAAILAGAENVTVDLGLLDKMSTGPLALSA